MLKCWEKKRERQAFERQMEEARRQTRGGERIRAEQEWKASEERKCQRRHDYRLIPAV